MHITMELPQHAVGSSSATTMLVKAKDRAGSSQERAKILDTTKMCSMEEWSSAILQRCGSCESFKRQKNMFDACYHQKESNIDVHQERQQLRSTYKFFGESWSPGRPQTRTCLLRESSLLCLISLESAMELDSLQQARTNFQKLAKKPYRGVSRI